jgi:ribose 5-phosphate isomerase B
MKIALGSDHAGYSYKQQIIAHLKEKGHEVVDFGTHSPPSTGLSLVDHSDSRGGRQG